LTARKLHFVLQGKGGVGKTVVALLLSQYIDEKGEPVICVSVSIQIRLMLHCRVSPR